MYLPTSRIRLILLLSVTEWNEFRQLDLAEIKKLMKTPNLIDGRNIPLILFFWGLYKKDLGIIRYLNFIF